SFVAKKPLGGLGLLIVLGMAFVAIAAPLIERYPPDRVFSVPNPSYDPDLAAKAAIDPTVRLRYPPEKFFEGEIIIAQDPSWDHWFGTDLAGRDLYSAIVHGGARTLGISLGGAVFILAVGTALGAMSAYFGGSVDIAVQRVIDALMAFP